MKNKWFWFVVVTVLVAAACCVMYWKYILIGIIALPILYRVIDYAMRVIFGIAFFFAHCWVLYHFVIIYLNR